MTQNESFTFINYFSILASGCDLDSAKADCGSTSSDIESCTLSNGYSSGSCCSSYFQCDLGEGDCDKDEDCLGDYICGDNNCVSPFPANHDCCTTSGENFKTYRYSMY